MPKSVKHNADGILAPNVTTEMLCIKSVPETGVANEERVDRNGAAAAESLVVVVAGFSILGAHFEIALKGRIGVAEDRDRGTHNLGILLAEAGESLHLGLDRRKDERRVKLEADVTDTHVSREEQIEVDVVGFSGGRGCNEKFRWIGRGIDTCCAALGRGVDRAFFLVVWHR